MSISLILYLIAVSVAISAAVTPAVIRLAHLVGAIDKPDHRKVHSSLMPRLGGVAIATSFLCTLTLGYFLFVDTEFLTNETIRRWLPYGVALVAILVLGFFDDRTPLKAGTKLLVQVVVATAVYASGFRLDVLTVPFVEGQISLGLASYPLTLLWIVGTTNALNLIDGLDGLASGVALIVAVTIFFIAHSNGSYAAAGAALALAGALAGFLIYNFHPARIFLGDSGSLFLGFALSILTLQESAIKQPSSSLLIPILALGLPIMDTLLAMVRRFLGSFLPERASNTSPVRAFAGMFSPDRSHIHHQLILRGISHRNVVLILYGVSIVLGATAYFMLHSSSEVGLLIVALVATGAIIGIHHLDYHELPIHRNGIMLLLLNALYRFPVNIRIWVRALVDLLIILFSATAAMLVAGADPDRTHRDPLLPLALLAATQMIAFWLTGLYKHMLRHSRLADLPRILSSVAIALAASMIVTSWLFPGFLSFTAILVNSILLGLLTSVSRFLYEMVSYSLKRESTRRKGAFIVGIGSHSLLLQDLLTRGINNYQLLPKGFLETTEGRKLAMLNGYPVFQLDGDLAGHLARHNIEALVVAAGQVSPESLARILDIAHPDRIEVFTVDYDMTALASDVSHSVTGDHAEVHT